ncbi:MAG: PAS domain S-box protein [Calditrichota bacterium]
MPSFEHKEAYFHSDEHQTFIDAFRDGIFLLCESHLLFYNRALTDILDLPRRGLDLEALHNRLAETRNATARGNLQRLNSGKPFGPIQYELIMKSDLEKTIELVCRLVQIHGRPAIQGVIIDLTREYAIEAELFDTLTLFNSIFDAIDEAIFILDDPELTVRSSNIATNRIFRLDRSTLKGKTLWHLLADPNQRETYIQLLHTQLLQPGGAHFEEDMRRGDGIVFPALHTITEVKDTRGRRMALMWIISDLTQQAYLNRALAEVETRYRIIFDREADPTFIVDAESLQILDSNKAAEMHLGYTRAELIGQDVFAITPSNRYQSMKQDLELLRKEGSYTFTGLNVTKKGNEIPVQINSVYTSFGRKKVFVMACRDITQQLEHEQERLHMEKLEAVRQVAGGIAHEFSQPLQGLLTISEIMETATLNALQQQELAARIPPLVERMNTLLNQMKGLVRLAVKPYTDQDDIVDIGGSTQVRKLLIVDREGRIVSMAKRVAATRGIITEVVSDLASGLTLLEKGGFSFMLVNNFSMTPEEIKQLPEIQARRPQLKIINGSSGFETPTMLTEPDLMHLIDKALT